MRERKIALRQNSTGEVRIVTEDEDPKYPWIGGGPEFCWTEGNYSCDCNRALFFARAGDEPDPDDRACGEVAYTALWVEHSDGTREPMEEDLPPAPKSEEGKRG